MKRKEGSKLFITPNGYEFVESYLTDIYSERGKYINCFKSFVKSDFFNAGCRYADNLDDIPEISIDEIKSIIKAEENTRKTALEIQARFDDLEKKEKLTKDDYSYLAGIFGLAPSPPGTDWFQTLFPFMVDLFVPNDPDCIEKESAKISECLRGKDNLIAASVSTMIDAIRDKHMINYHGREIVSQGYAKNYFRGEAAYYKTSYPSICRGINDFTINNSVYLKRIINIFEFCLWLESIEAVKTWPYGNVNGFAIAQHYGIPTPMMDITSDIKVALFFACCYFDANTNSWKPVDSKRINDKAHQNKLKELGGNPNYGILFSSPAALTERGNYARDRGEEYKIDGFSLTPVEPVGYQPFQRCSNQSAYTINAPYYYDTFKDMSFSKVKFKLNDEFSKWIFEEMEQGKCIYPYEGEFDCSFVAEKIKKSNEYSEQALLSALNHLKIPAERAEELIEQLKHSGYTIKKDIPWCSESEAKRLSDSCYKHFNEIKFNPTFKFGFCI